MNSCLYTGQLWHRRLRPREHEFRYAVSSFYLDLDELPELDRRSRLFGCNRGRLFSFHDRDHMDGQPGATQPKVLAYLRSRGLELDGGKVCLLTQCRLFGYVFNPISVYYCYAASGELRARVAEVNNTFGERILYLLESGVPGGDQRHARSFAAKEMHVSPFVSMDARYEFRLPPPGERLSVFISETEHGQHFFDAHLWGERRPLEDRSLVAVALRYPLLTLRIVAGIHWQALRLWWKGVPFYRQPAPSAVQLEQRRLLHRLREETGS